MKTRHQIIYGNSQKIEGIQSESVDLVVTSPPYPMIEMWDEIFKELNPEIGEAITEKNGREAFELMNKELDKVWKEMSRILKPGGMMCINIGDATRKINEDFQLYSNHARILSYCLELGLQNLPAIIWRKQTNAPNKFMGSGMLAPNAYVTLEHEYILILRKGGKRVFKNEEKENRQRSGYFWEERNAWFSDLWELKGRKQLLENAQLRERSAAFPFELAYRLVNMFSVKGDTVIDPFLGTGTTMFACMTAGRNSIGVEIEPNFEEEIKKRIKSLVDEANECVLNRLEKHLEFVEEREKEKGKLKYQNLKHDFPVMTTQEKVISIDQLLEVKEVTGGYEVDYLS
jgi:DNA modification methylase